LKADAGLADESARLATDASAGVAASAPMYADVEARLLHSGKMEGIALRYGFFSGPNTWYCPEGAAADHARRWEMPIVGQGEGVWSFVHSEDAALASVAALTAPPGMYNVVDDDPSPVSRWLPAFAR
jgi:nucleoside-diphosphate-sugar epimerase